MSSSVSVISTSYLLFRRMKTLYHLLTENCLIFRFFLGNSWIFHVFSSQFNNHYVKHRKKTKFIYVEGNFKVGSLFLSFIQFSSLTCLWNVKFTSKSEWGTRWYACSSHVSKPSKITSILDIVFGQVFKVISRAVFVRSLIDFGHFYWWFIFFKAFFIDTLLLTIIIILALGPTSIGTMMALQWVLERWFFWFLSWKDKKMSEIFEFTIFQFCVTIFFTFVQFQTHCFHDCLNWTLCSLEG